MLTQECFYRGRSNLVIFWSSDGSILRPGVFEMKGFQQGDLSVYRLRLEKGQI